MKIERVRKDLDEVRFYYANQLEFDSAAQYIGKCSAAVKAEIYNAAVTKAPGVLYKLYLALYVNGSTQQNCALDFDCSVDYICRLNKRLCEFFVANVRFDDC